MAKRTGRPWSRVKRRVLVRDRGICHLCGLPGATTADHITPVAHGGSWYDLANLAAAHHVCNLKRGTKTVAEARALLALDAERATAGAGSWRW